MSNLNQFIAQGNLTDDPRVMGEENNVVRFAIAVNNGFGDRRTTTFVDCVGFGNQAAVIGKHLSKGKQVIIRGMLIPNSWEDKEGNKRTKLEVRLENVNGFFFVGNGGGGEAAADAEAASGGGSEGEPVAAAEGGEGEKLF
ncbi:MAG: single-stranded DNA-binding protein [Hydrogenophaga sp.]|uniref:single-stranded DNA-binding protein n=1 Tax=Hydrogenophaga sp. TaxID=1904254 RepID=UPI0026251F65|nr:single-stranded DNA-binding protein [Hydrogenophaga sp.]MCV0439833.1 single-stranded DNA-binding protein [Hydrogenophaga sp.]